MTALNWEFVLMVLSCAIAVLGFLFAWKKTALFRKLRAGAIIAWLWVYDKQQLAAIKERNESLD